MTESVVPAAPSTSDQVYVRPARPADVRRIKELVDNYAGPILLAKSLANLYEDVTEFYVAEVDVPNDASLDGTDDDRRLDTVRRIVGCGALHVLWEDLAEIRTVATDPAFRGRGIGRALCSTLIDEATDMGLQRLFCLTFEVDFFAGLGFYSIAELELSPEAYNELRRSYDTGVAEFLDLPYVKPNTLGNTRMIKYLY